MSDASFSEAVAKAAAAFNALPPAEQASELRRQRHAYAAAEMAWGSDADEAAYASALAAGDTETMARLNAEGEARRKAALAHLDRIDP